MIRSAVEADADRLARICLLTGATGDDATGKFGDDTALADVYATPYLYGPGGFALVWDVEGEARGYVVGTSDTLEFQRWFVDEWWPGVGPTHRQVTADDEWLLASARDPKRMLIPQIAQYPAHLHIDLLPDQQGRGAGRALIEGCVELLAERGAAGVHLVAEKANRGAQAFYPRVGFVAIDESPTVVTFARTIDG